MVVEAVRQGELNPEIEQAEGIVRRYNTENDTCIKFDRKWSYFEFQLDFFG